MPFDMDARIDEWKMGLLDTSKRNRLINFTTGRVRVHAPCALGNSLVV